MILLSKWTKTRNWNIINLKGKVSDLFKKINYINTGWESPCEILKSFTYLQIQYQQYEQADLDFILVLGKKNSIHLYCDGDNMS